MKRSPALSTRAGSVHSVILWCPLLLAGLLAGGWLTSCADSTHKLSQSQTDTGSRDEAGDLPDDIAEPDSLTDLPTDDPTDDPQTPDTSEAEPVDTWTAPDSFDDPVETDITRDTAEDTTPVLTDCGFEYEQQFPKADMDHVRRRPSAPTHVRDTAATIDTVSIEPDPPFTYRESTKDPRAPDDLTMPGYDDNMPLFERAQDWSIDEQRCYEMPPGAGMLSEKEAYDLYRNIAEQTTGVPFDTTPGRRSVVGLRGAYPGTFAWHGNTPNYFNDTLVLLWIDEANREHVKEFPVHTDVGAYDFGYESSSSLRPNRRYDYINDWHRSYNALRMNVSAYRVRDDSNHNGHWDSDRNGWLPPNSAQDHDRQGNYHNIHMASVNAPLWQAHVDNWSAGCQVIPGMTNWTEFILSAWTGSGDHVDYFLIDVRDIAPEVWFPCSPDGTHECPFPIDLTSAYHHTANTAQVETSLFDLYNCSDADESGPEVVYVLQLDRSGTLEVSVDCQEPVDIDVHLLDGDDENACLSRGHWSLDYDITPGRYLIVADTWVDEAGSVLAGEYTLNVTLR